MFKSSFISLIFCASLSACGPIACTAEYVTYSLSVKDREGNLILLDSISVTNADTNEVYPDCNENATNFPCLGLSPSGEDPYYTIMNDGFKDILKRSGTRILVEGAKDNASFSEEYVFSSGPCHVELESGSLEITLE